MKQILLCLLVGLCLSSLYGQEETFRQYYGAPYPFADEDAFTAVPAGDRMAIVGIRENQISLSKDLAVWFFDPATGVPLDSVVVAAPGDLRIIEVYPGPDGGFLVAHVLPTSGSEPDMTFTYLDSSGEVAWEQAIPDSELNFGFDGIKDLSFVSATELYFSVSSNGSGDDLISRLVHLNSVEGITETVFFGEAGATSVWSIEYQPNGDLLIAGQALSDVFVALLDNTGEVRWRTQFDDAEGSFGLDTYEYLSDAHRPAGEDYILATGKISGGRAVLIMDTLGNRLEEYTLEDFPFITEKEQVNWFGRGDTLFVNDNSRQFSVLYIDFGDGNNATQELIGNAGAYRVQGGYYDLANNQVVSALDNSGDVAIARSSASELEVNITNAGVPNSSSSELAVGVYPTANGGFLLQTTDEGSFSSTNVNLVLTDAEGDVTTSTQIASIYSPQPANIFQRANDGNYMVYVRGFSNAEVKKFTPEGTELWSVPFMRNTDLQSRILTPLPRGRFALNEYTVEQLPDFSFITVVNVRIGDSTGTISDTLVTNRIALLDGGYAGHDNDLLITGTNFMVDSARIISYDAVSGEELWEYTSGAADQPIAVFSDVIALESGNYGLLFNASARNIPDPMNLMEFVRLDPDGEELSRYAIPDLAHFIYSPKSNFKGDTVTLVFGESAAGAENAPTDHGIRVYRFISSTGEVLLDKVFPAYFGTAMPAGISSLADGRTAMLVTTAASDTSASEDILLLVFDAEGNITNLHGTSPLLVEVSLSPNPTPGLLHLQVNGAGSQPLGLYLFDAGGRVLEQTNLEGTDMRQTTFDLSSQPAGTYFVMLRDAQGKVITRRVVKQ